MSICARWAVISMISVMMFALAIGCSQRRAETNATTDTAPSQDVLVQEARARVAMAREQCMLLATEEIKGGEELTYADGNGVTRIVRQSHSGGVYAETISFGGKVIGEFGWHENGSLQHERLFHDGKAILDVSWHSNGRKEREYVYENSRCVRSTVWYPSGQIAEENVYDSQGRYMSANRWYEDGTLKYEASFREGNLERRVFYKPDGSVDLEQSSSSDGTAE